MGMSKNLEEGKRWLAQAQQDLADARTLRHARSYASSCFHAQQAAEKAAKGLLYAHGIRAIVSHSVTRLLSECAKSHASFAEFADAGKELDRHYIGSRYPDFYAEGAAHEYYTQEMADKCIRYATSILSSVDRLLSK
jgi:HEPN domain-containing protein